MLISFLLGAKFVAIYALFLGVKFGLEDLLRVKDLTFRNSVRNLKSPKKSGRFETNGSPEALLVAETSPFGLFYDGRTARSAGITRTFQQFDVFDSKGWSSGGRSVSGTSGGSFAISCLLASPPSSLPALHAATKLHCREHIW